MYKILIIIMLTLLTNASIIKSEEDMNKIVISKFDEGHNIPWAVHDMVEILLKEDVAIEKINKDAVRSYWTTKSLHNFRFGGYASFLFEIKNDEKIKLSVFESLKSMGAQKHLAYMLQQEKVYQTFSSNDKKQFLASKYMGYIDKKLLKKVKGSGYKDIYEEENLEKLHTVWLKALKDFTVGSFDEKYAYLSKVVGKNIMPIDQKSKDIYTFLLDWNNKKVFFDLESLSSISVWGEIEKFYWREWAPDAIDIDTISDEFYSFAEDGAGGHYLLWYYEGMKKDPPVVYFSSEGEKEFLASSFSEYILTLPHIYEEKNVEAYLGALKESPLNKNIAQGLYDLFSEYEEQHGLDMSAKEMAVLLTKEIQTYLKLANEKFSHIKYHAREKERFEKLSTRLDGEPLTTWDYIKAYYQIAKRLGVFGDTYRRN